MNEIAWIKKAVKLCIGDQLSDFERRKSFAQAADDYARFTNEEKAAVAKTMKEQFARNDCIYIYSVFLQYMGNRDFADHVIDLILEGKFDAYIGSMLEVQIFKYMKDFRWAYAKIRKLHRKNIEAFDHILQTDHSYIKPQNRNRNRIVLVTEQLLSYRHAPTKIVSNFLFCIRKLGYEVLLWICPCDYEMPQELWFEQNIMNSLPGLENMPLRMYYRGQEFEGYQINMKQQNMKEYHMMLSLIRVWNPIFVFDMGTINPVVDLAGRFTTLAALEMSILCPVSEGEILIRLGREEEALEQEYAAALLENQTQLFMEENIPVIVEETEESCQRSEIGLPKDRFLMAIVGNRLDLDVNDDFIRVMGSLLEKIPHADFVIIGETGALQQKLSDGIFKGRVYFLGYVVNLMEIYGCLNLYINPDRPGGGFSSSMALMAGLPVVTLPNCDVAYNVGDAFVVADFEQMEQIVVRYAQDQEFYQERKDLARSCKVKHTDAKMEAYVKKLLDEILRLIHSKEEEDAFV